MKVEPLDVDEEYGFYERQKQVLLRELIIQVQETPIFWQGLYVFLLFYDTVSSFFLAHDKFPLT